MIREIGSIAAINTRLSISCRAIGDIFAAVGVAVTALARRGRSTDECACRRTNSSANQRAFGVTTDGLSDQGATDAANDGTRRAPLLFLGRTCRQGQRGDRRNCTFSNYDH